MATVPERVRDRVGPGTALLVVAALGLLARLWALGWRVAHQDESRVAHWILHYREFGIWEYRPIIHGPFLPHVNGVLFSVVPPSDFSMRLVVAVVGGLLPLAAWLFREHLRDSEVVALGLLLAANPLLLYYSRFMRNDLLVAAFMLAAFGLFVRASDTRDARYLYAGVLPFALAFTAKELALVYPVSWAGATLLLLDHRLVWATEDGDWTAELRDRVAGVARGVWRWRWPFALATLEFLVVVVLFYAPKGTDPGLWTALSDPLVLPAVVEEALLGSWEKFAETWGGSAEEPYMPYFFTLGAVLVAGALVLLVAAALGFLADRYRQNRDVVAFCGYWGVAHLFGIPVAIDNPFPWEVIHTVVPLAVPAAVGLAFVYRLGRDALADDDTAGAAAAAVLLLLAAGQVGVVAADTSYLNPQSPDNDLVQFAQPAGEMQPTLERIYEIDRANGDAVDVVFYGQVKQTDDGVEYILYQEEERWGRGEEPPLGWWSRLPLPWYFAANGVEANSTTDDAAIAERQPPVVVAFGRADLSNPTKTAADVAPHLEGYCRVTHQGYLHSRPMVFFVRGGEGPACGPAG